MNDAIRLLWAERLLNQECLDRLQDLKHALQENTDGAEVTEVAQAIQPTLNKLKLLEKRKHEFLQQAAKTSMIDYGMDQSDIKERDTVLQLLQNVHQGESQMRRELDSTKELLKRSKQFVDYHINVMTQTAANDTYVPRERLRLRIDVESRCSIRMSDTDNRIKEKVIIYAFNICRLEHDGSRSKC